MDRPGAPTQVVGGGWRGWLAPARRRWVMVAVLVILVGLLAALAARADMAPRNADPWSGALDICVGLAFILAAWVAPGPVGMRSLMGAVGVTWLVASFVPELEPAPRALLAIALLAFPDGHPHGSARWLLVFVAAPTAVLVIPTVLAAVMFGLVAGVWVMEARSDPSVAWYPAASAAAVAATLGASWLSEGGPLRNDPRLWLTVFELVLIAIAVGFPVSMRAVGRSREKLADRVLSDERIGGLDGLASVLGDVLGDPRLQVYRWDTDAGDYVDPHGSVRPEDGSGRQWFAVDDASGPVGAVSHASAAMADPPTAAAVANAVRLTVLNVRWQEAAGSQLVALEAARSRLLAVGDRQRMATAARLHEQVVDRIGVAVAELHAIGPTQTGEAMHALGVARQELDAATDGIVALVQGVPPMPLGGGGLVQAVRDLAGRCPVPVTVTVGPEAAGAVGVETALFYVCSEAITNAVKHARASRITVILGGDREALTAVVSDDGIGGAQPSSSGLLGLADRLAARAGRLQVDSPPGAGTTLTAWIPR